VTLLDFSSPQRQAVAMHWRKSSLSTYNGNCVEVAGLAGETIRVRDSKNPQGGILSFTTEGWDAFIGGVRNGEFNRTRGAR
jgi:Domain of unknown function (DUF397)